MKLKLDENLGMRGMDVLAAAGHDVCTVPQSRIFARPMLQWVGKKPLSRVTAFPAQLVETFDP